MPSSVIMVLLFTERKAGRMYDKDGPFGQVRLRNEAVAPKLAEVMDHCYNYGWHKCNKLYQISRKQGARTYLVIFTMSGTGNVVILNQKYRVKRNSVVVIPAFVPHQYYVSAEDSWEFYWVHMIGSNCERLLDFLIHQAGNVFEISNLEEIAARMEILLKTPYRYYEYELFVAQSLSRILFGLLENVAQTRLETKEDKGLVEKVISYIEANYQKQISLREIRDCVHVSVEHIIRVFKSETGTTPGQYLKVHRIGMACQLLDFTDLPVKRIAVQVGYRTESWFITQFKELKQLTPAEYRRASRQGIDP